MTNLWHLVTSVLLVSWLATAISWSAAGAAISSWGGRSVWLGAVIGGLVPVLGAVAVAGWSIVGRRSRRPEPHRSGDSDRLAVDLPRRAGPFQSSGSSLATAADILPLAGGPFGTAAPFGAVVDSSPFGSVTTTDPFHTGQVVDDRQVNRWLKYRHDVLFIVGSGLLAAGFALSLLSGDWADLSTNVNYSMNVDAWGLGLGELLVISAVEFAIFVPLLVYRRTRRTRWPAVLAVFAGCWWGLLCWIAYSVTDGLHRLLEHTRLLDRAGGLSISAGWIWLPMLACAAGAALWGSARLVYLHRTDQTFRQVEI